MNLTKYVLDADGQPIAEPDLIRWVEWMGAGDNKVIAREQVYRHVRVVTTFLGYDLSTEGDTLLLWDTIVYGGRLDCRSRTARR